MSIHPLKLYVLLLLLLLLPVSALASAPGGSPSGQAGALVLAYHRFGPVAVDSMTVTTHVFLSHLKMIEEEGFHIIPLTQLIDGGKGAGTVPPRSVVITVDDGHLSVFTELFPLIKQHRFPVTLFIYPSAISNASYAMTWDQIRQMKATGLVDIQSHTYWHPNFKQDRKRMSAAEFDKSAQMQLEKSRARLEREFDGKVDVLAWPFGIYDDDLKARAARAGYRAALSIDRKPVRAGDDPHALPRYLMSDRDRGEGFRKLLREGI